jgi:hypothetical protein
MKAKQVSRIARSPARIRRRKVRGVRRRLKQGRYDIDTRLAVVLDKILEDLIP